MYPKRLQYQVGEFPYPVVKALFFLSSPNFSSLSLPPALSSFPPPTTRPLWNHLKPVIVTSLASFATFSRPAW